jgi:hypothetical protein
MLADRQRELPFLTAKDLDDDGVREVNAAIALGAVRLIVSRDRDELEAVLDETALPFSSFHPRTKVVNWNDAGEERSFGLDVRIHHNTQFPLELPIQWTCLSCGAHAKEVFVVSSELTPAHSNAYSEWLDRPCSQCGSQPRNTRSTLGGEDLVYLSMPPDPPDP